MTFRDFQVKTSTLISIQEAKEGKYRLWNTGIKSSWQLTTIRRQPTVFCNTAFCIFWMVLKGSPT